MEHQALAEKLLWPLWRGIGDDFKDRYKKTIWEQFENNIRSAAYTAKLSTFLANITGRLSINIQAKHLQDVNEVVSSNLDREILTMLREETTYLVMIVHLKNQERKEAFNDSL